MPLNDTRNHTDPLSGMSPMLLFRSSCEMNVIGDRTLKSNPSYSAVNIEDGLSECGVCHAPSSREEKRSHAIDC